MMAGIMGGRAAEELSEGPEGVTMGASSDIEQATGLAETMVRKGGLGPGVGPRAVEDQYAGKKYSEALLSAADEEVTRLLGAAEAAAKDALERNRETWEAVANALLANDSLTGDAFQEIVQERALVPGRPFVALTVEASPTHGSRWFSWLPMR